MGNTRTHFDAILSCRRQFRGNLRVVKPCPRAAGILRGMYARSSAFSTRRSPLPRPRYLFMGERHREALAHLLYGLDAGGGLCC